MYFDVPGDPNGALYATAFQLVFGAMLPFTVVITCNVMIIITVKKASKTRLTLQSTTGKEGKDESQHLMRMLISVSMAYLVTAAPYRLVLIATLIPEVAAYFDISNICYFALYNMIVACLYTIWISNHAVNFYMYCLGGGARYKKDLAEVLVLLGNIIFKCKL